MQPAFISGGAECAPGYEGAMITFLHDSDNSVCGGDWTCMDTDTFVPAQGVYRVFLYYSDYWLNLQPNERSSLALRQIGEGLGLDRHPHLSCEPDPWTGQTTIMSIPLSPCPTLQEPAAADLVGLVCGAYEYDGPWCGFNPPAGAAAQGGGPDADGDGWADDVDNCPAIPNPLQEDRDIDGAGDACDTNDDGDTFTDADEAYIGTDGLDSCNATNAPNDEPLDAWPPDFDDSRVVNTTDVFKLMPPVLGSSVGDPYFTVRADLAPSGVINTTDVFRVLPPTLGSSCVSTASQLADAIKATEQYRSVAVAESDGFVQTTENIPGRGAYFTHPSRMDDDFSVELPQGLIYDEGPSGWRLAGAFYLQPVWLDPAPPSGFIGSDDVWAIHENFCIAQGLAVSEGVSEAACGAAGGVWWEQLGHFLPAWLFRYNPDGVFQELHPNLD